MAIINMDHTKNPDSTVTQLEFSLPVDEIKEHLDVGQRGWIRIPVEVIQGESNGMISFRKAGKSASEGAFQSATASELRNDLPVAER